jgi:pimeloyl-ACP methyl ester carboxylesterase
MDDGVQISVRVRGPIDDPRARRVLFVHGWMASGATWDPLLAALSSEGVVAIVPDLRGTGASDQPASGHTLARFGQDLVAVLDALDVKSATVVGHSMGGELAQWMAAEHPARVHAAVGVTPVPASGLTMPPEAVELFATAGGDAAKLGTILELACKDASAHAHAQLLADALTASVACVNEGMRAFTGGVSCELSRITQPFLVVASDDPFLPVPFLREAILAKVKHGRMAFIPGAGHYPHWERTAETAAVVEAFLAGLVGARA